ncbi:MAG: carboxylating nicotinate-nucleotide diphosphorylase [Candidatus Heimdallarchaeota archaeon]|nr:carboxylating nicotinate-nucleotide diphosphorylase [Candidatus Heimdallarchaeota archaeon]
MNENLIRDDVIRWIAEDIPLWDNSSSILQPSRVSAKIVAKQQGIISGTMVAKIILELHDIKILNVVKEGSLVQNGEVLIELEGNSTDILQAERTCLNIFSHMSGISTYTRSLLDKVKDINPQLRLAATRKTLPGLRRYQKWAVKVAGADTHRMSLSDMIMLKENHISMFPTIDKSIETAKKNASFSTKIEVEVRNNNEAREATKAGADIVMLDNYTPEMIVEILPELRKINPTILLEASGNINEHTIADYAKSGVDIVSMGKLTHSVTAFDMSLIFDNLN